MDAATAATERATLFEREISPFPYTCEFGHCIFVVANDFKRICVLGHETSDAGTQDGRLNISWFDFKPFSFAPEIRILLVQALLQFSVNFAGDPTNQQEFGWVSGLEISQPSFNVAGPPNLEALVATIEFKDKID
jgi:hypothetical protein